MIVIPDHKGIAKNVASFLHRFAHPAPVPRRSSVGLGGFPADLLSYASSQLLVTHAIFGRLRVLKNFLSFALTPAHRASSCNSDQIDKYTHIIWLVLKINNVARLVWVSG